MTVRLLAVGDLQLGDSATCVGFGFRSRVTPTELERTLLAALKDGGPRELQFANLETPLSDSGLTGSRQSFQLRGAPEYAQALKAAGFNLLNVANNHALEHGAEAFTDSVDRVASLGIAVCGRRGSDGWTAQPVRQEIDGLRVGALGFSMRPVPAGAGERYHAEATGEQIIADVRRLKADRDCVIVSLHWGEEFVAVPSTDEVALAHAIVDAGATVILGHHPHVARPVERYENAVVAYSLGNFAADMIWHGPLRRGLVLECRLSAAGVEQAQVRPSFITSTFATELQGAGQDVTDQPVQALAVPDYLAAARGTVRDQRRALYVYTLLNAWRFKPRTLLDLAASTIRGKAARLTSGQRDEIWG